MSRHLYAASNTHQLPLYAREKKTRVPRVGFPSETAEGLEFPSPVPRSSWPSTPRYFHEATSTSDEYKVLFLPGGLTTFKFPAKSPPIDYLVGAFWKRCHSWKRTRRPSSSCCLCRGTTASELPLWTGTTSWTTSRNAPTHSTIARATTRSCACRDQTLPSLCESS